MSVTNWSAPCPPLIVFRDVRAIDPHRGIDASVDVVIEDGVISRIDAQAASESMLAAEGAHVVNGEGKWLVPGFVDLRAHLREPGKEYKEDIASGLRAAAAGGYAHICAMPDTDPVNDRRNVTESIVARARSVGGPTLHPIGAITLGRHGEELTEMADLRDAGVVGVSDGNRSVRSSAVMRRALEYARNFDLPVMHHAEDHTLTAGAQMHEGAMSTVLGLRGAPRVAEDIIVARDLMLTEATGARYHLAHVSTEGAVRLLRDAKARGISVTAEVTAHHLMLTHDSLADYDTAYKFVPPLREQRDVEAVRSALADGTIDAIVSDHAPQSSIEKDCEFQAASPGAIGLELVVPVLLRLVDDGSLPLARFIGALTRGPAGVIGLDTPTLETGRGAELCLIDPEMEHTIDRSTLASKCHNSPFVGKSYRGGVVMTMARGRIVYARDAGSEDA